MNNGEEITFSAPISGGGRKNFTDMFPEDIEPDQGTKAGVPYKLELIKAAKKATIQKIKSSLNIEVHEFGVVPDNEAPILRKGVIRLNTIADPFSQL